MIQDWERATIKVLFEVPGFQRVSLVKVTDEYGKIYYSLCEGGKYRDGVLLEPRYMQLIGAAVDRDVELDLAQKR